MTPAVSLIRPGVLTTKAPLRGTMVAVVAAAGIAANMAGSFLSMSSAGARARTAALLTRAAAAAPALAACWMLPVSDVAAAGLPLAGDPPAAFLNGAGEMLLGAPGGAAAKGCSAVSFVIMRAGRCRKGAGPAADTGMSPKAAVSHMAARRSRMACLQTPTYQFVTSFMRAA